MDRAFIDKYHLVDLYVQGRLSDEQLEEFEIYMLEHPDIVNDVEFAKGLQNALYGAKETVSRDLSKTPTIDGKRAFWLGRRYAVAATALLVISSTFSASLYFGNVSLRNQVEQLSAPSIVRPPFRLNTTRSALKPTIVVKSSEPLFLQFEVPNSATDRVEFRLLGARSGIDWEQSDVEIDRTSFITILVPKFQSDEYELIVRNTVNGEIVARFLFDLEYAEN